MDKLDEDQSVSARDVYTQKNMRMQRGILFDLEKLKNYNYKLTHNYVVSQILTTVLPRILEKIQTESIISLNDLTVRL